MSNSSYFRPGLWVVCIALALVGACAVNHAPPTATHQSAVVLNASEQLVAAEFEVRVKDYLILQRKLEASLPTVPKRASPEQVDAYQRAMGALVKNARADATQGEFFTPGMQALVKRTLAAVIVGADRANTKASIMDENPGVPNLGVNERYPDSIPLSTMPPQVLESLPMLEDTLEYHFIGERLVLMDAHAHIVLDFTDDVLP